MIVKSRLVEKQIGKNIGICFDEEKRCKPNPYCNDCSQCFWREVCSDLKNKVQKIKDLEAPAAEATLNPSIISMSGFIPTVIGPPNKYVSEVIDSDIIKKLQIGNSMVINGPTGCGKSQMLVDYIKEKSPDETVIIHTPRRCTKRQLRREVANALEIHLKPYFSNRKPIRDLKPKDIESFCSYKLSEGKSPKTVHKLLSLIGPAFRYAEKNDFIIKNPMNVIDKPLKSKSVTNYYNAEQLNALAKAAKGSYIETPVILAMILGLRRSEIVGLTWDNVDFENRLIHIRQAVIVGDSSILTAGTYKVIGRTGSKKPRDIILKFFLKTDSSERSFTMNDDLYNYLISCRGRPRLIWTLSV